MAIINKKAFIDPLTCKSCNNCIPEKKCGANAIVREDEDYFVGTFCAGCRICVSLCPFGAIKVI